MEAEATSLRPAPSSICLNRIKGGLRELRGLSRSAFRACRHRRLWSSLPPGAPNASCGLALKATISHAPHRSQS